MPSAIMTTAALVSKNVPKNVFGVPELEFVGHHVSSKAIWPLTQKVLAIQDVP